MSLRDRIYLFLLQTFYSKSYLQVKKNLSFLNSEPSPETITGIRDTLLKNIIRHAMLNVPYYKVLIREEDLSDDVSEVLTKIPVVDKAIIRNDYQSFISKIELFAYKRFNTGGSTGEPLEFRLSRSSGINDYYHQRKFFLSHGYSRGDKILSFDGTDIPTSILTKGQYWSQKDFSELPYGRVHASSHYFNNHTAPSYIDFFLKYKPKFLRGYPSFIYDFVSTLQSHDINVDFVKNVTLTAEEILPSQMKEIGDFFQCDVYGQYGHSEAAVYAITRANDLQYHCSPFYGYTEVIDDKGYAVSKGEEGEVVVTGFFNFSMPFIRYKTGDRAIYGGEENGYVILDKLLGRTQDFVFDQYSNKIHITGLIFGQHIESFRSIHKWQIVQKQIGNILVKIVPDHNFSNINSSEIVNRLSLKDRLNVEVQIVKDIPVTSRGKHRFVINELLK